MSQEKSTPDDPKPPADGDRSLIRWMLSLSPAERLRVLQEHVSAVESLRAKK